MSQKGVYPYDHMDSFEKFDQTELPTKDQFYSILNDQHITNDEYNHAKKVWKVFSIKTMGEYHDLYLKVQMKCFFLFPNLKEQQKSGRSPFTVS